jgi:hypothetical protein
MTRKLIHEEVRSEGVWQPKSMLAVYLLLGSVTLTVGVGLFALSLHTLSGIETARNWVPTPAVVERGDFVRDDEGGRTLDLKYRYEFQGQIYRSDRLDLLPGRMGDDNSWEEQLLARSPVGAEVTCYVNPANPQVAVLDREHGTTGARNLQLMAFPFVVIAAAFLLAAAKKVLASKSIGGQCAEISPDTLGDVPRRLKLGARLAIFFTTPTQIQLAWAFFMGFAIVFTMLEGPAAVRERGPADTDRMTGEVTRVEQLDQREFTRPVYEYEFRYELDGKTRTGKSHTVGQRFDVGDSVEIVLDPQRPDSARIAHTRRRFAPLWVIAVPLVVMLLLGVGIVGNYAFNFRTLYLARNGLVAIATRRVQGTDSDLADTVSPRATLSKYEFQVGKQTYPVDPRSWLTGQAETIPVLYAPHNPARNVGLGERAWAMLSGTTSPWPLCLSGMLVPVACFAALAWLWGGR